MDPGSALRFARDDVMRREADGELKNLSPHTKTPAILIPCPRDGLLAERPSVWRGLGGAVGRGNAPSGGSVNRTSNVAAWFEGKGPGL